MTGHSPKRHRECIDLMIMKKTFCYDIKSQQTLGILDTEFNQKNKRIERDGMKNVSELGKVSIEQFSIKNTSSIDQIVSERCVIDHNQSKTKHFALTSLDLEVCNDRVIYTAASLALLRVGITHIKIHSMFSSIHRKIHMIKISFGDSNLTYEGGEIGYR